MKHATLHIPRFPFTRAAGAVRRLPHDGLYWVWCGSRICDKSTGLYHLFGAVSEGPGGIGAAVDTWNLAVPLEGQ